MKITKQEEIKTGLRACGFNVDDKATRMIISVINIIRNKDQTTLSDIINIKEKIEEHEKSTKTKKS